MQAPDHIDLGGAIRIAADICNSPADVIHGASLVGQAILTPQLVVDVCQARVVLGGLVFVIGGHGFQARRLSWIRRPYGCRFFARFVSSSHLRVGKFFHFRTKRPRLFHSELGRLVPQLRLRGSRLGILVHRAMVVVDMA